MAINSFNVCSNKYNPPVLSYTFLWLTSGSECIYCWRCTFLRSPVLYPSQPTEIFVVWLGEPKSIILPVQLSGRWKAPLSFSVIWINLFFYLRVLCICILILQWELLFQSLFFVFCIVWKWCPFKRLCPWLNKIKTY